MMGRNKNSPSSMPTGFPAAGGGAGGGGNQGAISSFFGPLMEFFRNKRGASQPAAPSTVPSVGPGQGAYQPMDQGARQQLLSAMLQRARGGQPATMTGTAVTPPPAPGTGV